jgi:hypothetical protein
MDLLTTHTHHSELQVITALSLISAIRKSPQHPLSLFPACCASSAVSWQRILTVKILRLSCSGSLFTATFGQLLSTVNSTTAPSLVSHPCRAQLKWLLQTVLLITSWHGPHRKHPGSNVRIYFCRKVLTKLLLRNSHRIFAYCTATAVHATIYIYIYIYYIYKIRITHMYVCMHVYIQANLKILLQILWQFIIVRYYVI